MTKPLILAPAGSFDSLISAVNAGADEVYFGLSRFNARNNAKNFTDEQLSEAVKMCKILGVKTNVTLNTLVTDKEMPMALDMVGNAANIGVDAFIVQDLGLARQIKTQMPSVTLHASTQCACHNAEGAKMLKELGFDRVVLAREMPRDEIKKVIELGIETEIFVQGALCVCHSGMCLMSSVIGDRSGNRGLCAQPCRLPYKTDDNKNEYPLSLRDLSLATHIEELIDMGITSLKIEGRMKSPEYVYGTTKIWRTLIDGEKNADKSHIKSLEDLFSRGGFTDKYFTGEYTKDNGDMYGIRKESDKKTTRITEKNMDFGSNQRKRNITVFCNVTEGEPVTATALCDGVEVTYQSDFEAQTAKGLPMDSESIKSSLLKLGGTYFAAEEGDVTLKLNGSVFLAKSQLNQVRRSLCQMLEEKLCMVEKVERLKTNEIWQRRQKTNEFSHIVCCKSYDIAQTVKGEKHVSFPLWEIEKCDVSALKKHNEFVGVALPRVIYSGEMQECKRLLCVAKNKGADFALVSNIGAVQAVKECGLTMFGDIGMNVFNSSTVAVLEEMGFCLITVSPELNEAQIRDMSKSEKTLLCGFVKGRLPLMVLESCIVKAGEGCKNIDGKPCTILRDRIGKDFYVFGERRLGKTSRPCRNIIYNSVETNFLSKTEKLSKMNLDTGMIILLEKA